MAAATLVTAAATVAAAVMIRGGGVVGGGSDGGNNDGCDSVSWGDGGTVKVMVTSVGSGGVNGVGSDAVGDW